MGYTPVKMSPEFRYAAATVLDSRRLKRKFVRAVRRNRGDAAPSAFAQHAMRVLGKNVRGTKNFMRVMHRIGVVLKKRQMVHAFNVKVAPFADCPGCILGRRC